MSSWRHGAAMRLGGAPTDLWVAGFRDTLANQLRIAAAEKGVALLRISRDHARRSTWRVAAKRAPQLCHMLTIEDRRYPQWLPPSAA